MDVDLPGDDQTDGIHTTQDDNPDLEVGYFYAHYYVILFRNRNEIQITIIYIGKEC